MSRGQVAQRQVALPFADRAQAGRILADRVAGLNLHDPLVLALPRGGVAVAGAVARRLNAEFDVLVTRKIGYPPQPELGVGAISEGGAPVYDDELLHRLGLTAEDLAPTLARERKELARRMKVYRGDRPLPALTRRDVVVVDDGLATGVTARAGLRAVRAKDPRRTVLAVPVGAIETERAMHLEADDVVVLATPWEFRAVGQWYDRFDQLTDADVLALLSRVRSAPPAEGPPAQRPADEDA